MDFEQLSIPTVDTVTEITLRIGLVGTSHAQAQVEVHGAGGELVALISKHHLDIAVLEPHVKHLVEECISLALRRHLPF